MWLLKKLKLKIYVYVIYKQCIKLKSTKAKFFKSLPYLTVKTLSTKLECIQMKLLAISTLLIWLKTSRLALV